MGLWGKTDHWRYEAMLIAGLDADRFNNKDWIRGGSGSPYEFKIASSYAGAARVDNYSIRNLRLSLSGYLGNSAKNTLNQANKYDKISETVAIGAFDFLYKSSSFIARGNVDYGHLSHSLEITQANKTSRKDSPSPKNNVAEGALALGAEAGYNLFALSESPKLKSQQLFVFGRYDYYDSMFQTAGNMSKEMQWQRQKLTLGLNYFPIKQIVIKGEYSYRIFKQPFNNEPTISIGIAYSGLFER